MLLCVIPLWANCECPSEVIFQERGSRVAARICLIEGREPSIGMAMTSPRLKMPLDGQGQVQVVMPEWPKSVPKASAPPPPPPLPTRDSSIPVPRMAGEKSQMSEKLDKAVDVRQLSAHDVVHTLRLQLEQIFEPSLVDQVDLSDTVNSRVIIIHGPTGTGKSTVIPWEAMRWLEEHCSQRGRKAGRVIC